MRLSKDDLRTILERLDISRSVYRDGKDLPVGWRIVASSAPDPDKATGFFGRLYEKTTPLRPGESKYLFAFRGTHKASDFRDLLTDANILFHRIPKQHERALAFVKKTCEVHGLDPKDVELTGHSSGGYLARTVAMTIGAKNVWAFNSPGPSSSTRAALIKKAGKNHLDNDHLIQVRSVDDLVGRWGYDEGIILEVVTKGDHHSVSDLRAGVAAVLDGVDPVATITHRRLSLRGIYNVTSQKIVRSERMRKKINELIGLPEPSRASLLRPAIN